VRPDDGGFLGGRVPISSPNLGGSCRWIDRACGPLGISPPSAATHPLCADWGGFPRRDSKLICNDEGLCRFGAGARRRDLISRRHCRFQETRLPGNQAPRNKNLPRNKLSRKPFSNQGAPVSHLETANRYRATEPIDRNLPLPIRYHPGSFVASRIIGGVVVANFTLTSWTAFPGRCVASRQRVKGRVVAGRRFVARYASRNDRVDRKDVGAVEKRIWRSRFFFGLS